MGDFFDKPRRLIVGPYAIDVEPSTFDTVINQWSPTKVTASDAASGASLASTDLVPGSDWAKVIASGDGRHIAVVCESQWYEDLYVLDTRTLRVLASFEGTDYVDGASEGMFVDAYFITLPTFSYEGGCGGLRRVRLPGGEVEQVLPPDWFDGLRLWLRPAEPTSDHDPTRVILPLPVGLLGYSYDPKTGSLTLDYLPGQVVLNVLTPVDVNELPQYRFEPRDPNVVFESEDGTLWRVSDDDKRSNPWLNRRGAASGCRQDTLLRSEEGRVEKVITAIGAAGGDEPDRMGLEALAALRAMLGPEAEFRDGQLEAIRAVVERRGRVLVVQRTGWGKSIVYFIATRLLRDRGAGLTLIVSPLLALMRDQIRMAEVLGIRALTINSSNNEDWQAIERKLRAGECDLLLVSPERLANQRFHEQTLPAMGDFGLFVVDEAHCISDWGHAFRPDYRRIERIIRTLPLGTPVLATTATANDRVIADVQEQLGTELEVLRGPLARESLQLQVVQLADQAERLAWLAQHLHLLSGSGIIYCLTKPDTLRVAEWLRRHGHDAEAYNADLDSEERIILEDRLRDNDVKALVATVALGMGFDKPDLGFVVHFQAPGSIVGYYQQIGRAGRALPDAYAVLLVGEEDQTINQYFIDSTFPPYEQMQEIVELIEQADDGLKPAEIEARLNIRHGQLETALKMLEVDGVVQRQGYRYFRTANPFTYDEERVDRVTGQRHLELDQMAEYVDLGGCLMEFVARALDDPEAKACGRCASCCGPSLPSAVDSRLVQEAVDFLRRASLAIEPRKQVPYTLAFDGKSRIPEGLRCERGVALCQYGDAGWGRAVKKGKYNGGGFGDELVTAGAALIRETWQVSGDWWVTSVPSMRHPMLVGDLAERLAHELELPYAPAVRKVRETQPQKELLNSAQLAHNVATAFAVDPMLVAPGPVILVDDVVDSRWTMTWCGIRLRQAGAGPVHPFALADAQGGGR